ncbi:nucleotide-binding-oligomerization-domain like receptor [Pyrrhoderma noxium]|uniref:Nucleotide-binding-oligomerization-domain like receptor n=1 Tax=Pyrrhoderma noxium TaxID=2282107 RepID=A0A286UU43_9AGAM|nr:nucleotide-binding-oligomerization-domain like receptor [Pyrrhoderma noxium]
MSFNQSGSNLSATFGVYNNVAGNQTNTTIQGDVNVQEIKVFDQDSNTHRALMRELKDILNPSDFAGDDRPECLENTRKETLDSIYQWVDASGYPNVLLLIGAAGTGKSTIATTVAGRYQRRRQLGCHMFFLREKSHPGNVLQSIAYSLADYSQTIAESLVDQLKDRGVLDSSNLKTKFDILLREPLYTAAIQKSEPILIVLDALDECGTPKSRQSLINVLRDRLSTLPPNFRFIITSRPENDILNFTSSRSQNVQTFDLDNQIDENKLDVSTFIEHELEELRSSETLRVPEDWPWDEGLQRLANTAGGLFIWASTAIKFISEKKLDRFGRLKNLVENRNMPNLNELYATILKNAFEWDEKEKKDFVGVFSFILFSKLSLSDESINGILGINTAPDILMYLRSLVVYERGQPIRIYHASFYDYLISCEGKPWHIDPSVQRAYIASKCFERMGNLLIYNICSIPSSFALNTDVPDIDIRVIRYIPPFLKYICCNWFHHLQDVSYSQDLCSKLQSFVYNQLLFWFEILSLTNTFNHHVGPALLFAIDWVGNHDPVLSSFLRDAYRQASIYSKPISDSVLHIYTSLLPLTKEESLMSNHYAEYADKALRVEYVGRRRRNDCIKTIRVGLESVSMLSFSPDGTQILCSSDRRVYVWDATSGERISRLLVAEDDKGNALSAAYLPDGRYVVVATRNGIIGKWDVLTSCLVSERVMSDFQIDSTCAATFSPDRKSLVSGDKQGIIQVWSVETREQDGGPLEGHTSSISCLSFSGDGKYLASGSRDATIIIWDMSRRRVKTGPLREHTEKVTEVSFSPCGTKLVSGSSDKTILVWDVSTGEVLRKIIRGVFSVTYSPHGHFILAGGWRWMSMWNVADDTAALKEFQVGSRRIVRASFSPDGSRFASVSDGPFPDSGMVQIWDATWSVEETKTTLEERGEILSISLSPGSKFIASGSSNGSICLWNSDTGELVKNLKLSSCVNSVAFSPVDEQLIAFGSEDGTVEVWDVTDDVAVTIGNHRGYVFSVVFSPSDGKHVASGSFGNTICIWDVERRELAVGPLTGHESFVLAVAYSLDGTRLVSGSEDNTVRIWNSETGHLLSTLNGHSGLVPSVAYSLDGSRIVSGSDDKTILVWDAQSGQIVCGPITGHHNCVKSVCFSQDGKRILSGSWDKTARVWDAISGNPLFPPFIGHTSFISSVCFFPDGRHFATGSVDGTIRIWTLNEIPIDSDWELRYDNWVVGENGKLMMWIPDDLHRHLCRSRNVSILNHSFLLKLHFGTE